MTNNEVMQMALDALTAWDARGRLRVMEALRAALAQPEHGCAECDKKQSEGWALYCVDCLREFYKLDPTNQRREWVGLTDEEIQEIYDCSVGVYGVIKESEAKLKGKNA